MFPLARCLPLLLICIAVQVAPLYSSPEPASQSPSSRPRPPGSGVAPAPSDDPALVAARAEIRKALVAENPTHALALLEPWLLSHPKEAGFHALEGEAFYALERFGDAVAAFDRAVGLSPEYRGKLFNYGRALQSLNRHEDALKVFAAMLESPQSHLQVRGYFGIGLSRQALGDDAGAVDAYRASLALNPRFHRSIYRLALIQIAEGEDEIAESALFQVLAGDPLHHGAAYNRALALGRLDRVKEADEAWTRYRTILEGKQKITLLKGRLRGTPEDFIQLVELGDVHLSLGLPGKGAEWYGRAAAIDPFDPRPAVGTVTALRALGNDVDAERLCTMLLERTPPIEELRAPLIELLEKRGAKEEAAKWRAEPKEQSRMPGQSTPQ